MGEPQHTANEEAVEAELRERFGRRPTWGEVEAYIQRQSQVVVTVGEPKPRPDQPPVNKMYIGYLLSPSGMAERFGALHRWVRLRAMLLVATLAAFSLVGMLAIQVGDRAGAWPSNQRYLPHGNSGMGIVDTQTGEVWYWSEGDWHSRGRLPVK
jgi:hypothetical protein